MINFDDYDILYFNKWDVLYQMRKHSLNFEQKYLRHWMPVSMTSIVSSTHKETYRVAKSDKHQYIPKLGDLLSSEVFGDIVYTKVGKINKLVKYCDKLGCEHDLSITSCQVGLVSSCIHGGESETPSLKQLLNNFHIEKRDGSSWLSYNKLERIDK